MFSVWKACSKVLGFVSEKYLGLYTVSTEPIVSLVYDRSLYQLRTQALPRFFHRHFIEITEGFYGLYPSSTEPITTTTLYKGGR